MRIGEIIEIVTVEPEPLVPTLPAPEPAPAPATVDDALSGRLAALDALLRDQGGPFCG